jgi:hypothetical protein
MLNGNIKNSGKSKMKRTFEEAKGDHQAQGKEINRLIGFY